MKPSLPEKTWVDVCRCGHERINHAMTFQHCKVCGPNRMGLSFACMPGACDRFTWDPDSETSAAERKLVSSGA